jgi:hypothetical protein
MSSYEDDGGRQRVQDEPLSRDPRRESFDPRGEQPTQMSNAPQWNQPYGYGMQQPQWQMRPRRIYPIETKPFFLTSEFVGAMLVIVGIAITAAASDAFGAWRAWILITAVAVGYMVSRGIAKSGTRSLADDPREHLDLNWGRGGGEQHPNDRR